MQWGTIVGSNILVCQTILYSSVFALARRGGCEQEVNILQITSTAPILPTLIPDALRCWFCAGHDVIEQMRQIENKIASAVTLGQRNVIPNFPDEFNCGHIMGAS